MSFVTRPTTGLLFHPFSLTLLPVTSSRFVSSLVSRALSLSLAPLRFFSLFVTRTIRETGALFISVISLSLYLSMWPTHRNKFHPPTLPFTHFSPADHPLRIGKQAIRLSHRSIFRRPTRSADCPKKGDKGAFLFSLPRPIGYNAAGISDNNYAQVIVNLQIKIKNSKLKAIHTFQTYKAIFLN